MSHFRYFLLSLLLIFYSGKFLTAQVNRDTCFKKSDTCILFMNRGENTLSISSQIATVGKDQLSQVYSLNMLSLLSDKMSGIDIQTSTAGNSASSVFFLRGERNLISGNQPVFIVDGIPIISSLSSFIGFDYGNLINDWNVDDIESVSVLKGGQAASMPVNMSGNGFVVVQTSKASEEGFHVNYVFSALQKRIADYPDYQNSYGQGYNGEFNYYDGLGGGTYDDYEISWGPKLDGQLISQFDGPSTGLVNGQFLQVRGGDTWARQQDTVQGIYYPIETTPWVAQPDNMKNFFQTAFTLSNNLGLSWANKNGGLRLSYTNVRADDIMPESSFQKNTIGSNFNYTFFDRIKVFGSFQNSIIKDKNILISEESYQDNPMMFFARMGRQVNTISLKKYWQAGQENSKQFNFIDSYLNNPYFVANEQNAPIERHNLFGSYGVSFIIAKGFTFNYNGGLNKVEADGKKYAVVGNIDAFAASIKNESLEQSILRNTFLIDYSFNLLEKHYFNTFAGISFEKFNGHDLYTQSSIPWPEESIKEIKTNGSFIGISYLVNNTWSARIRLNKDKYKSFDNLSSPLFYAVSGGVEINRLLQLPKVISTFSVQSGYSKRGLNDNSIINPFIISDIQNTISSLGEYTASLDMGIFDDRILAQIQYYTSKTKNGLLYVSVSTNGGYGSKIINTASVKNSGFELNLELIPVNSQKVLWKTEVSLFKNIGEVEDFGNGLTSQHQYSESINIVNEVGQPMSNLYGISFERFEGKVIYKNGLPQRSNTVELLGNANPDYIIYVSNSIKINKKIAISMNLEFSKGGSYYSPFYSDGTSAGTLANTADRENGIIGDGVKWDEATDTYVTNDINVSAQKYYMRMYQIHEYSIMDATFLKLKELSVSYPFILKQKVKIICSLFGQNLYTWSANKDYNNNNLIYYNNLFYRGVNNYNLPETYVLGLKIQVHV